MNVLLESPLGGLLARPWLDAAGLFGLRRYMPLSRLWAAANTAKGDAAVFRDQAGSLPAFWSTFQLRPLLAHHGRPKRIHLPSFRSICNDRITFATRRLPSAWSTRAKRRVDCCDLRRMLLSVGRCGSRTSN